MIHEFSVTNYRSFRDKQTISFEASSDKHYINELSVEVKKDLRILKTAIIYGANASGKSNTITAIQSVWEILFQSLPVKDRSIRQYIPFALTKDKPTEFNITFFVDNVKYVYYVKFNQSLILEEQLAYYPNINREEFYTRKSKSEIAFGDTLNLSDDSKKALISNTLENHSVLSSFEKTNIKEENSEIEKLYLWIKNCVHEQECHRSLMNVIEEANSNPKQKTFLLKLLTKTDYNITDFNIVESDDALARANDLINGINPIISKFKKEIEFTHNAGFDKFNLPQKYESDGTLMSIDIFRKFYDLISSNCVHLIDEFGISLHYDLLKYLILIFIRSSSNSQLIFTTHDQMLLDEDFIRRDMIWFSEKSTETAATELYSANEFGLHKNISLYNSYKIGKLGAKPNLSSTNIANEI